MDYLYITPRIQVPDEDLDISFARAGGPGGENVNKSNTKAVIRFSIPRCRSIPMELKARLMVALGPKITNRGEVIVTSQTHREQSRNLEECREKLRQMIRDALVVARPRRPTQPTRASKERHLEEKRRRRQLRRQRSRVQED